jgi:Bacterial toxin 44
LVKGDGIWDHKSTIRGTWGQWSKDKTTGIKYNFDIWSNVHYGYVGKACGFPDGILLDFAGAAQNLAQTLGKILGKIPLNIGGIKDAILSLIRKLLGITGGG